MRERTEPIPVPTLPVDRLAEPDPVLTMGAGDTTVLPSPLRGSYRSFSRNVTEVHVAGVEPDTGWEVFLDRLLARLVDASDEVIVRMPAPPLGEDPASPYALLEGRGFVQEAHFDPVSGSYVTAMVWRRP